MKPCKPTCKKRASSWAAGWRPWTCRLLTNDPALAVIRAVEQQPYDLVVLGFDPQEDISLAEQILQVGEHHLLLVPGPQTTPVQALICVTSGEPGKDDVLFAGRLVRHLGADATLLSVLPAANKDADLLQADRELPGRRRPIPVDPGRAGQDDDPLGTAARTRSSRK